MLPRADLNSTRPPAALEASTRTVSSTDTRLEIFRRLNQIAVGKELQATVDAMLDDGTYLVKVADTTARMALPVGTRVGDNLSMILLAKDPRPTFLLTQQQGSTPTSLSGTARLIDHLVQGAKQSGSLTTVISQTPLLASPDALNPEQVAGVLQKTVSASGLFYESHLHEWISGSRTLTDLTEEPQSRLPAHSTTATSATTTAGAVPQTLQKTAENTSFAHVASALRELGDDAQKLLDLVRHAQLQPAPGATIDADVIAQTQPTLPSLDPEAARLINLQLGTLENHQIRWQGELWPGQKMEWEISEDKPEHGSQNEPPSPSTWTSTVRFELPHLGEIAATIQLVGNRVHVQIDTDNENSAASLREFSGKLADALAAAGSPLDSLLVKQHEAK